MHLETYQIQLSQRLKNGENEFKQESKHTERRRSTKRLPKEYYIQLEETTNREMRASLNFKNTLKIA